MPSVVSELLSILSPVPITGKSAWVIYGLVQDVAGAVISVLPGSRSFYSENNPAAVPVPYSESDFYVALHQSVRSGLTEMMPIAREAADKMVNDIRTLMGDRFKCFYFNDGMQVDPSNTQANFEHLYIWAGPEESVILYLWETEL